MSAVAAVPLPPQPPPPASDPGIVACIDCADRNAWVYPHAAALADALDFPVTLLQVLDAEASPDVRPDPIEWNLRRREALRALDRCANAARTRSEEHTSELQSLMRISYAVFCLKKIKQIKYSLDPDRLQRHYKLFVIDHKIKLIQLTR